MPPHADDEPREIPSLTRTLYAYMRDIANIRREASQDLFQQLQEYDAGQGDIGNIGTYWGQDALYAYALYRLNRYVIDKKQGERETELENSEVAGFAEFLKNFRVSLLKAMKEFVETPETWQKPFLVKHKAFQNQGISIPIPEDGLMNGFEIGLRDALKEIGAINLIEKIVYRKVYDNGYDPADVDGITPLQEVLYIVRHEIYKMECDDKKACNDMGEKKPVAREELAYHAGRYVCARIIKDMMDALINDPEITTDEKEFKNIKIAILAKIKKTIRTEKKNRVLFEEFKNGMPETPDMFAVFIKGMNHIYDELSRIEIAEVVSLDPDQEAPPAPVSPASEKKNGQAADKEWPYPPGLTPPLRDAVHDTINKRFLAIKQYTAGEAFNLDDYARDVGYIKGLVHYQGVLHKCMQDFGFAASGEIQESEFNTLMEASIAEMESMFEDEGEIKRLKKCFNKLVKMPDNIKLSNLNDDAFEQGVIDSVKFLRAYLDHCDENPDASSFMSPREN